VGLGTDIRLSRLFAHPSGTLFGIAVDHFVGYGNVREGGLSDLPSAVGQCMRAYPDTMTMTPGTAKHCWPPYVGKASLIVQASYWTPDDRIRDRLATPADATRLGADALAVAIGVRGETEGDFIRWLADAVRDAAAYELPVVAHIYPRDYSDGVKIVFTPDEIAYAVRVGIETGVDVIKVGYPGDEKAFAQIIDSCPVPIVMAGGPKEPTLRDALAQTHAGMRAGALGAVVGRNIWGDADMERAARAYAAVIHDGLDADEALARA
jgi:class I fructose-bisphosphate aldolase